MPTNFTIEELLITVVDDAEIDLLSYDNTWRLVDHGTGLDNNTNAGTGSVGSPGSVVSFNFTGYGIVAFFTTPDPLPQNANQTLPNVTVALDDNTPTRVSVSTDPDEPFFSAVPLAPDFHHTLTITVDDSTDAFPFILDALVYVPPQDLSRARAAYTGSPSAVGASSGSGSGSGTNTTNSASDLRYQSLLQQLLEAKAKADGPPVSAIVGGTIGGVILLVLAGTALWYFCLRPRRKGGRAFFYAPAKASDMLSDEFDLHPEPYLLMEPSAQSPPRPSSRAPLRHSTSRSGSLS